LKFHVLIDDVDDSTSKQYIHSTVTRCSFFNFILLCAHVHTKLHLIQLEARRAARAVLASRRDTARNFGNAGEVDNLLNTAKLRKVERIAVMKLAAGQGGKAADVHAAGIDDTELVRFICDYSSKQLL
jgi:AAA lid domain